MAKASSSAGGAAEHTSFRDLMVGCGVEDFVFIENTCEAQGREEQHDPMVMEWCYRAHAPTEPVPLPASSSAHAPTEPASLPASSSCWQLLDGGAQKCTIADEESEEDLEIQADSVRAASIGKDPDSEEDAGAIEHGADVCDDMRAMGFAIAKSITLLHEFASRTRYKDSVTKEYSDES